MDEVVERLKQIGLNSYEAKVYLALLKQHPATGYEVSKTANIPQARAYDTLKALEEQNLVVATEGKPVTYVPVSPNEILSRYEKDYENSINFLQSTLPNYAVETVEPIYTIRGFEAIYDRAVQMIDSAKESICIEMWKEDEDYLKAPLETAKKRGIHVYVVGYHGLDIQDVKVYPHDREDLIEFMAGSRWFILGVDNTCGLITICPANEQEPYAIWSKNPIFTLLVKELVVHDIFLLDIEETLKDAMEAAYGKQELKLRRKILHETMTIGAH